MNRIEYYQKQVLVNSRFKVYLQKTLPVMKQFRLYMVLVTLGMLSACDVTKHVPEGQYLLDKVNLHTDINRNAKTTLEDYLRQTPNVKSFESVQTTTGHLQCCRKRQLSTGTKLDKGMGAPVIYDEYLTYISAQQLQKVYENKGLWNAKVDTSVITRKNKK